MNTFGVGKPQLGLIRVKQLRAIAGLTNRQIGDWEVKKIIPRASGASGQWRSFTPPQTFGLAVLAEVRRRFGIPVESLRWLGSVLMAEDAKHLYQAIGKISGEGAPVLLVTDLKKTLQIVSSNELGDALADGKSFAAGADALVMVEVNDVAKHVLKLAGIPMNISEQGEGYTWNSSRHARSPEEEKILALLRSVQFNKVEVDLVSGQVRLLTAEQAIPGPAVQEILTLTKTAGFQTVEVIRPDGKITQARRKIRAKPEELKLGLRTRRG